MLIQTRALVLRTIKYKDNTNIVELYTEALGRVSFIARLTRTPKGRMKSTLFLPLTVLDLEWTHRPKASLQRITHARIALPYTTLLAHPHKMAMALFLSEFLTHALREEQPEAGLFSYIITSLQWLDASEKGYANFHLVFLVRLSRFLGFFPNLDESTDTACFDLLNSCFVPFAPLHPHYIPAREAAFLPLLLRMTYDTMHLFAFSRRDRDRLLRIFNDYYRLHLPDFPVLKSLDVLRDVFGAAAV